MPIKIQAVSKGAQCIAMTTVRHLKTCAEEHTFVSMIGAAGGHVRVKKFEPRKAITDIAIDVYMDGGVGENALVSVKEDDHLGMCADDFVDLVDRRRPRGNTGGGAFWGFWKSLRMTAADRNEIALGVMRGVETGGNATAERRGGAGGALLAN